jgi:imidazoleglycerol-phosphate dehydratase
MAERRATTRRKTKETNITLELNLDGSGQWEVSTGIKMFDHLLAQVAQHSRFDLKLTATGDDQHHLAEDVALCFGRALNQALGEKRGIVRMADATVPMDDALAMVAVDISGRGYAELELPFSDNDMAGFSTDLIRHFLQSLAAEGKLNLHARILYGVNDHHKAEALFKALGRALDMATRIDERIAGELPSTKELLEGRSPS